MLYHQKRYHGLSNKTSKLFRHSRILEFHATLEVLRQKAFEAGDKTESMESAETITGKAVTKSKPTKQKRPAEFDSDELVVSPPPPPAKMLALALTCTLCRQSIDNNRERSDLTLSVTQTCDVPTDPLTRLLEHVLERHLRRWTFACSLCEDFEVTELTSERVVRHLAQEHAVDKDVERFASMETWLKVLMGGHEFQAGDLSDGRVED